MGMVASQTQRLDRLRNQIDLVHPVQRWFGRSRGVSFGVLFLVAMLALLVVRPLFMSATSWHRTASLLSERRVEVAQLQERNDKLKERARFQRTETFVQEQARSYGLVMPGEETLVIRELVHPESVGGYMVARLRNVTVDGSHALGIEATGGTNPAPAKN